MLFGINRTKKPMYLGFLLSTILTACGGESSDTNSTENTGISGPGTSETGNITISAQDATFSTAIKPSEDYVVDLSEHVRLSDRSQFYVSDVEPLSNDYKCDVKSITTTGFIVSAEAAKVCDYRYHVTSGATISMQMNSGMVYSEQSSNTGLTTTSAISRVAVSSSPGTTELTPISETTLLDTPKTIDILQKMSEVGVNIDTVNFTLQSSVILPFGHNSSAVVDAASNTITYTPESGFTGIDRILYNYEDAAAGEILMGTIDVAVAHSANEGLVIQDDITYTTVETDKQVVIDISPYVTSLDGDDYQLVYVDSFNADTNLLNPNDVNNKEFTFITSLYENHYVSFSVSDHNGAYTMGLIKVPTYDAGFYGTWNGVALGAFWYTRPQTENAAIQNGFIYSDTIDDTTYTPTMTMALFSYTEAQNGCSSLGHLATVDEMTSLFNEGVKLSYDWPVTKEYLADDNGSGKIINMQSGAISDPAVGQYYLATCVTDGFTVVSSTTTDTTANDIDQAEVVFSYSVGAADATFAPSPNETMLFTVDSNTAKVDVASGITDANGQASVRVTNTISELVKVCAEVGADQACSNVMFVADQSTAVIVSADNNVSGWVTGSNGLMDVSATVTDVNGNIIENAVVSIDKLRDENTDSLSFNNTSAMTDQDGIAHFQVVNNERDYTDFVRLEFTHEIASNNTTSTLTDDLLFGSWQWSEPLSIKIHPFREGDANFSCSNRFGSTYRGLTLAEIQEWKLAYDNGDLTLDTNWRKDPILVQLDYWLKDGGDFYADARNSMSFWVGDVNTQRRNAIRYNQMNYNAIGTRWGTEISGDLKNIIGWNFESAQIAASVLAWEIAPTTYNVNYTQLCFSNYADIVF
ncbi:Ig-like domain-containing protein [Aliivibrio logei]|uniref:Big-1 domain-containing protein n=1 Tax=Aliivibrio logei 5S-186 TaxID=626086 RepID=A0ABX3B1X4_ALILO|nr:Ig-like domain-containing protein [Aliivibrio logei]OEF22522.1 hypothetical protein A1Q5_15715 [Aliivibrio logei 5S-186]